MKYIIFLIILFAMIGCSNKKIVYWCGDHACVSNKEKELYFKKTMIVEIRELNSENKIDKTEIEKIKKQISKDEKKRILSKKKIEKMARLKEKEILKNEKKRIKENKKLEKKLLKENKIKNKNNIKKANPVKPIDIQNKISTVELSSDDFEKLLEKINKENIKKPYPDINNLPN